MGDVMMAELDPFSSGGMDDAEARKFRLSRPRWVDYELGNLVLDKLSRLYHHPTVPRPPCALIFGDTNNGKTALARKFAKDHNPPEGTPDPGRRPVVYAHAPPFADLSGFYDSILRAINAPFRSTARAPAKWDQLLQLLPNMGTRPTRWVETALANK